MSILYPFDDEIRSRVSNLMRCFRKRVTLSVALIFILFGCAAEVRWAEKIKEGDYSVVKRGRVPYASRKIESPSEYDDLIREIRDTIAKNPGVIQKITTHFFSEIPKNLTFQYRFSLLDKEKEKVILRYFAKIPESEVFAGVAFQFVVDVKTKEVLNIYTIRVPFE